MPAEGYPPLRNFDGSDESIWEAIFNWKTATPGADAGRKANKVENAIIETMRAYVDADRAARAPADSVQEDAALLDWLEQHDGRYYNLDKVAAIVGTGFLVRSEGNMPQVHSTLREAVYAARKQGATNDR